jgi:hypothetical protein
VTTREHLAALALAGLVLLPLPAAALAIGGADTITVRERQIDVNPGQTNPCRGTTGTVVDNDQDVFHITTLANGTLHLTGHGIATVTFTPDDPAQVSYAGHETFAVSEGSSASNYVTTSTRNLRLKGSDGTFITIRERTHLTVTPTGVSISFEKPRFLCP